jgi:hypothetical protein
MNNRANAAKCTNPFIEFELDSMLWKRSQFFATGKARGRTKPKSDLPNLRQIAIRFHRLSMRR